MRDNATTMSDTPKSRESNALRNAAALLALLLVVYLLGFVAILLDEMVFQTFFFTRYLPDWCKDAAITIYDPLIRLVWSL